MDINYYCGEFDIAKHKKIIIFVNKENNEVFVATEKKCKHFKLDYVCILSRDKGRRTFQFGIFNNHIFTKTKNKNIINWILPYYNKIKHKFPRQNPQFHIGLFSPYNHQQDYEIVKEVLSLIREVIDRRGTIISCRCLLIHFLDNKGINVPKNILLNIFSLSLDNSQCYNLDNFSYSRKIEED